MSRVVHFEVHVENPQRAIEFYGGIFGWEFTPFGDPGQYWLIKTGPAEEPGIDGGMIPRRGAIDGQAVIAYVCTIQVASLDATLEAVTSRGGALALPKMGIPGVGWLAYAKDPEGNIFGLMEPDPQATC